MDDAHDELLADDLEAFLAGEEGRYPPGVVLDAGNADEMDTASLDDAANWTLRRIHRAKHELERIRRMAQVERDRIAAWEADRAAGPEKLIEGEERTLEAITRRLVALNPKRKTVNLPNGTVKLAAPGAPSLAVDDEKALLEWLKENHPEQIETSVEVIEKWRKADVKKLVRAHEMSEDEAAGTDPAKKVSWAVDAETGERVPGVHLETPAADRFTFEL